MIIDISSIDYDIRSDASSCIVSKASRIHNFGKRSDFSGKPPKGWVRIGESETYINAKIILKAIRMYDAALALLDEKDGNAHFLLNLQAIEYKNIGLHKESNDNYIKIIEYSKITDENGQSSVSKSYLDLAIRSVAEYEKIKDKINNQKNELVSDEEDLEDNSIEDDAIDFATEFVEKIAAWDFDSAFEMLHDTLKSELTPTRLKKTYREMVKSKDLTSTSIMFGAAMDDWPNKADSDLKWCYLSVSNNDDNEAIAVVVSKVQDKMVIRQIEWGRP
jgi:tetratricopeptide (TPR) repeat protein